MVLTHRRHLVFSIFLTISYTVPQNMINKSLPHTKHLMTIFFLKRDMLNINKAISQCDMVDHGVYAYKTRKYMRIQNAHRYAYKTRILYIWVFCMHIHASKRHIYMRLKCLVKNNTLD